MQAPFLFAVTRTSISRALRMPRHHRYVISNFSNQRYLQFYEDAETGENILWQESWKQATDPQVDAIVKLHSAVVRIRVTHVG